MSTVDETKLAALKREIAAGIDGLDHARYQTYTDANVTQLADDIGRTGRIRLSGLRPGSGLQQSHTENDYL